MKCNGVFFKGTLEIPCSMDYGHKGKHSGTYEKVEKKHGIIFVYTMSVRWLMNADKAKAPVQ